MEVAVKPTTRMFACSVLVVVTVALVGCGNQKLIPNTHLADSKFNREIVRVVESYRRAMEKRDPAGVLALVHPGYDDNSGTPDASDDLDYTAVKKLLGTRFKRAKRVRLRIEYQRLESRGREVALDTWIDATFIYEHPDTPPRWRRYTDYNRFRLIKEGSTWRFISGL